MNENIRGEPKSYDKLMTADKVKSKRRLLDYLCFISAYQRFKKSVSETDIERTCAMCECQCAYGKRWLEMHWAEEDAAWEAQKAAEAAKAAEAVLEKSRAIKRQAQIDIRKRKKEGLQLSGTQKEKTQQTWLYIALKPYWARHRNENSE